MAQSISITVEITGEQRAVTSHKNPNQPRTFYILSAYADLPGHKYPQAIELFVSDPKHLMAAGTYNIPLISGVKDNRAVFEFDLSAARPVQKAA